MSVLVILRRRIYFPLMKVPRNHNTASTRTRDNQTGLLQLSLISAATVHSRATSARSKCGRTFHIQFTQKRTHDALPHPATLWLPVRYRVQYKLCILMHNIRSERAPRYLSDIAQPTSLWSALFLSRDHQLRDTSAAYNFRRTGVFYFRSGDLEIFSCRLTLHLGQCWFKKKQLKTHFFHYWLLTSSSYFIY